MIPKPETSPKRSGSEDSSVPKSWKMRRDKPKQEHRPQRPHRNISLSLIHIYDENGTRRQDIEIYYSFVGKIDLPEA